MRGPGTRSTAAILAAGPLAQNSLETWALIHAPLCQPNTSRRFSCFPRSRGLWPLYRGGVSPKIARGVDSVVNVSAGTARRGDADGRSNGQPTNSLDIDPETLARAREAALNDDYEWYMEFIEGSNDEDGEAGVAPNSETSEPSFERASVKEYQQQGSGGINRGARDISSSQERIIDDNIYQERRRREGQLYEQKQGQWPSSDRSSVPGRQRRSSERGYSPAPQGQGGRGSYPPSRRTLTPADTAYDYDFDDEFVEEPGQGGWTYDTDLTPGVATRRRDVDLKRVRSRARVAAQRQQQREEQAGDESEAEAAALTEDANRASREKTGPTTSQRIGSEKVSILTKELGYTNSEVSRMDPYMAELAIQRRLRRPASGMPPDWAIGSPESAIPAEEDLENLPGALNLDEILGSSDSSARTDRGYDNPSDVGESRGRPRSRSRVTSNEENPDDERYYQSTKTKRWPTYRDDREDDYGGPPDESGYYRGPSSRLDGREEGSRSRERRRRIPLDSAEKYERRLRGWDEGEERSIWTGVGDEGPWPTLEEFTKLLREETDVRLSIVGPWAADIVAAENHFRLNAYSKWLEVLDKGVGQTLLDAGFFDARVFDDDDFSYDDDDADSRRGGGGDYSSRGQREGRGSDFTTDMGRGEQGRLRPRRRQEGRQTMDDWRDYKGEKFDVGSFLRGSAEKLVSPAPGMEEQAARFEREYPGRRRPSLRKEINQEDAFGERRRRRPKAGKDSGRWASIGQDGANDEEIPISAPGGGQGGSTLADKDVDRDSF